jgi:hypothetical protein
MKNNSPVDPELFRHQCEVRYLVAKRFKLGKREGETWLQNHLALTEKKRGPESVSRLKVDIAQQWSKGNRGEYETWID